jgi:hypothetical protein
MSYHLDDIDEKILDAIGAIFEINLQQQQLIVGDPLALITLLQAPLQDDPTLTAPYVVYSNDQDSKGQSIRLPKHGHEQAEYGSAEIGGPIRYLYCYTCQFGTPERQTRAQARSDAACLMNRIVKTIITYAMLSNVLSPGNLTSEDGTKYIEGQNNRLVSGAGYSIFGGEATFFGKGRVCWLYPISWDIDMIF